MVSSRSPVLLAVGVAICLAVCFLMVGSAARGDEPTVETSHATIEGKDGRKLSVVFAAEGQPVLVFRPARGVWDWSATSKLFIPVENPGDEPATLELAITDDRGGVVKRQHIDGATQHRRPRGLDRSAVAAKDGHDRGTVAEGGGDRAEHIGRYRDERFDRRLACDIGPARDAATRRPAAPDGRAPARRAAERGGPHRP